ncbi:MAG TPA: hypothetical protein VFJ57_16485 [Solirubrobacterales bacterium]|nr:hypothetical protein [Solirubrobacterales bacterium]
MAVMAGDTRTDERLNDLKSQVDQRFDAVDRRFDAVDQRFDAVDQRFDAVDQRLNGVDQRIDRVEQRMDAGFAELREDSRALRTEIHQLTFGLVGTVLVAFLGTIAAIFTQT